MDRRKSDDYGRWRLYSKFSTVFNYNTGQLRMGRRSSLCVNICRERERETIQSIEGGRERE
jgi:hypothetical protein